MVSMEWENESSVSCIRSFFTEGLEVPLSFNVAFHNGNSHEL